MSREIIGISAVILVRLNSRTGIGHVRTARLALSHIRRPGFRVTESTPAVPSETLRGHSNPHPPPRYSPTTSNGTIYDNGRPDSLTIV